MAVTITISGKDESGSAFSSVAKGLATRIPKAAAAGMAAVAKAASAAARAVARSFAGAASSAIRSLTSIKGAIVTLAGAVGFGALIKGAADANLTLKAFAGLLRATEDEARGVGRELVGASLGMVSFKQAMQLGNRALASGTLSIKQLRTAMTFISKTAIASGLSVQDSFNKVITGLVRGSTLLLDDFGILVGGVDEVKERFDSLRGAGAFNALGEGAKKAEIIGEAVRQMGERLSRLSAVVKGDLAIQIRQIAANMRNIAVSAGRFLLTTKLGGIIRQALTFVNRLGSVITLLKPAELGKFFKNLFAAVKPTLALIGANLLGMAMDAGRIIFKSLQVIGTQLLNDLLRGLTKGVNAIIATFGLGPVDLTAKGKIKGIEVPLETQRAHELDKSLASIAKRFEAIKGLVTLIPLVSEAALRPVEERFGRREEDARRKRRAKGFSQIGEALGKSGTRLIQTLRGGGKGIGDVAKPLTETIGRLMAEGKSAPLRRAIAAIEKLRERGAGLRRFRSARDRPELSREEAKELRLRAKLFRQQASRLSFLASRGVASKALGKETDVAGALLAGTETFATGIIIPRLQATLASGKINQREFARLGGLLVTGFERQTATAALIAEGVTNTAAATERIDGALSGLNTALVGGG